VYLVQDPKIPQSSSDLKSYALHFQDLVIWALAASHQMTCLMTLMTWLPWHPGAAAADAQSQMHQRIDGATGRLSFPY